jgi:pyrroloquinoline quinone (PQQ) biosynthesis protein C
VKEHSDDELLNKWTTIQEDYGDKHEAIKALDDGKCEVSKVLKYILDKDIPIKKIYAVTSDVKCTIHKETHVRMSKCTSDKLFKMGKFSGSYF